MAILLSAVYLAWFAANQLETARALGPFADPMAWLVLLGAPVVAALVRSPDFGPWRHAIRVAGTAGLAALLALHVRASIIERVQVVGESMAPTYASGDILWVEKVSVGLRPPPLAFPLGSPFRTGLFPTLGWGVPPRGAVVVLRLPGMDRLLVKRVVAVAGDSYSIAAADAGPVWQPPFSYPEEHTSLLGPVARRALFEGCPERGVVPANTLLVLGDNRAASRDSRAFGFVPIFYVEGVALGGGRPRTQR